MAPKDYDTTIAGMAGNIAAGLVSSPDGYFGRANENTQIAGMSVALARAIVEEVRRTEPIKTEGTS